MGSTAEVGSPAPLPWTAVPSKTKDLVTRTIADETVVVPVRGRLAQLQNIYVLSPVGAHLWAEIDGSKDLRALHQSVLSAYAVDDAQAQEDLQEFLHSILDAGLCQLTAPGAADGTS